MAKAYLTPYGVGLGHASRLVMVADRLQKMGMVIRFSSFGEAATYISMQGYKCIAVPPVEFAWNMEGEFSIKYSIANTLRWFTNFSRQINKETRSMAEYKPDIIVSDSRLSSLITAKFFGIPSVVILNQVKLLLSPRLREFRIARLFEKMTGEILGVMWTTADKILVPDLPPPYTIASHNIWDTSSVIAKLEYVGFTAPKIDVSEERINKVANSLGLNRSRPVVFVHISGPIETRKPIIRIILEACKSLRPEIQYIISEGRPKGNLEPKKLSGSGWYYEWCPVRNEIFAMSNLLVLRGGHVALSQAIQFGKPIITIPIENHGEQLGNSEKIVKIGAGLMLKPKELKANHITDAVHQILDNPTYQKNSTELMRLTEKLDGINNIVKIIRSYL
ncbi:MAG TPA: nucleotide disphospho-sugar-binding domain-containing protein [Nitrososphaeraceae archaeon]|nr:nucleotide disphospho-sugar-binding domain-containing protein [Nitrososphaeraceae archaeon]